MKSKKNKSQLQKAFEISGIILILLAFISGAITLINSLLNF